MTDITELAQSLKAAAEKATQGNWRAFKYHDGRCGIVGGHHDEIMVCEHISKRRPHDAEFIALANPANILALVEALEKAQQMIDELEDRIALAAMDSESECLPLDYLQGHKDGLEWASQLAEANHPETGDWLYDDPTALAKAIRKGPDMPPAQPVAYSEPVPVVPDEKPMPNPLSMYAVDAVAAIAEVKGWNACRAAMLAAAPHDTPALNSVQSVATVPGKWIPVSEQMPEDRTQVILWDAEIGEVTSGHYSHKTHTFYHCGDATENEITHWMAPPAAPQGVGDA
ncbi:TPA: ead/Ea22-like family protein [Klebsiella quasipneumoniae subsp. similipneumoniae]